MSHVSLDCNSIFVSSPILIQHVIVVLRKQHNNNKNKEKKWKATRAIHSQQIHSAVNSVLPVAKPPHAHATSINTLYSSLVNRLWKLCVCVDGYSLKVHCITCNPHALIRCDVTGTPMTIFHMDFYTKAFFPILSAAKRTAQHFQWQTVKSKFAYCRKVSTQRIVNGNEEKEKKKKKKKRIRTEPHKERRLNSKYWSNDVIAIDHSFEFNCNSFCNSLR